jgi:hypothetical protein
MDTSNARPACTQQLELFDRGQTLIEVSVSALTTEPELREIGRALVTLTRYHATKIPGEVRS